MDGFLQLNVHAHTRQHSREAHPTSPDYKSDQEYECLDDHYTVLSMFARIHFRNNKLIFPQVIIGAIAPNDITVWPMGYGTQGLIPAGETLHYRIRFHNTGTYTAENVHIEDLLPEGLDLSTFELESNSHSTLVSLKGNRVSFDFPGINLPDSISEPEKSQGFIIFKVKTKTNLTPGTLIPNQASIVFDYEDPIKTNTVQNTILGKPYGELTLQVWPNPTQGKFKWAVKSQEDNALPILAKKVRLIDMLGRYYDVILSNPEADFLEIPGSVPRGIYVLEVQTVDGAFLKQKIVLE